jgi:Cytochrome P450.
MTFAAGPRSCVGFKFSQLEMSTSHLSTIQHARLTFLPEIVLCQLLEPFKFEIPQDKEIFWQLNGITRPGVEGEFDEGVRLLKLQLPLLVSKAD